jgi:4-diphosphocytidyl-2-C-methyl-D-erythritol kinase
MHKVHWGEPQAAPAKINLFLHIVGRRPDGYHLLQSVFTLIGLKDELVFEPRDNGRLVLIHSVEAEPERDLVYRAADALRKAANAHALGATISLVKRIPMGGGLGGGSSDAATTLLALNQLWELHLPRDQLAQIGLKLGADVPFFVHATGTQNAAFVEGIGEQITPIALPRQPLLLLKPRCFVATATVFSAPNLTRNSKPVTISDFVSNSGALEALKHSYRNDLEPVVKQHFPPVRLALEAICDDAIVARMSGSGACVFAVGDRAALERIAAKLQAQSPEWLEQMWLTEIGCSNTEPTQYL